MNAMDTNVRFEPSGKDGLVATGQTVLGAARALGLEIPTDCGAVGKCDSCAVFVREGADGLSTLTDAERTILSPARLAAGERLACQAQLQGSQVTLHIPTRAQRAEANDTKAEQEAPPRNPRLDQLRADFDRLPLPEKVSALAELGLNAAGDVVAEVVKTTERLGDEIVALFRGKRSGRPPGGTSGTPTGAPPNNDPQSM